MELNDLLRALLDGDLVLEVRVRRDGRRTESLEPKPDNRRRGIVPGSLTDRVLELLREVPEPVSAGDLAEYFGTSRQVMRVILSRMHRRGYLARHGNGHSVRWSLREVSQ